MMSQVPQPPGLVETPTKQQHISFAYQQLLSFYRGELKDPHASAAVEERVRNDRRWQAHWESIRYLDLDRAAAVQDASDLARFTEAEATEKCKAVAQSGGRIFDALMEEEKTGGLWSRKEWLRHADRCVYCRRMRRLEHARLKQHEVGLPAGEPLLRDWLLLPYYLEALHEATARLGYEWMPHENGANAAQHSSGDTFLNQDTLHGDSQGTEPSGC